MRRRTSFIRLIPFAGVMLAGGILSAGAQTPAASPEGTAEAPAVETAPAPARPAYSGSDLFKSYCSACHGRSAKGDGPVAAHMKKPPPDLTLFAERNGGVFPAELVRKIIDGRQPLSGHGGPDMPSWGDAFKRTSGDTSEEAVKARIDALVRYLEGIQVRRAGVTPPSEPSSTR